MAIFLCQAKDPSDLETKLALLRAYDIPVVVQSPLQAQFTPVLFGGEILGADLYVPEEKREEALSLLESSVAMDDEEGFIDDSQGEI